MKKKTNSQGQPKYAYQKIVFNSDEIEDIYQENREAMTSELSSEDLKEGQEMLFAFENQMKNEGRNCFGSPIKSNCDDFCPSF